MRKKAMSIFVCAMIVVSISSSITQNVGEPNPSSSGTVCPILPNSPEPSPQVVGQPSSNLSRTMGPTLSDISAPISQIVGQPTSNLSGSGGLADSPWPMFHHNLNHTGLSPYETSSNPGKLKWSFTTGDAIRGSSPAIGSDGTIYVGSSDNKLYAINPDGSEKWNFATFSHVYSSPAIGSDGTIYVGSDDNKLYAINSDGTQKWSFTTAKEVDSSPAIGADGTIYVGSHDYKLYAVNPNGTEKWSFQTGSAILFCSPAISSDGTVYIGTYDNKLYAVNPDGTKKWDFATGNNKVWSSPAIGCDGTIYVGSNDYKLYAINPDGSEKWNFTTGHVVRSSPAIGSDGTIYVGSYDNKIYAINLDGTEKWSFNTGNDVISSPAIGSDGTIFAGSDDNKLYAINPNGIEKWSFTTGGYIHSSPAIDSDGTIYIGSSDHKLYAIGTPKPPPIAYAGPDQTVNEGDVVQFMGCNSSGSIDGDPPSVDPSVVALWHMDEGSGPTIYDETSNINDGIISGATWTSGKFGSALTFGETDLVYEIPASFDDSITTNITVVAWVYWEGPHPGTYSPNSYIFDARDFEGTRGGFILYLDPSGTLVFILLYGNIANDYQIIQSTCKVPIKRWTHISGVLDYTNGELKLYINGMEDTSVPSTEPYHDFGGSHWDAAIGNNRYAPGDNQWAPFNGIIDEVVIYNEALTAQELPSTPAKIISYKWDFDASDGIDWDNPDAKGPTPIHIFGDNGIYMVTLKITDDTGATDTNTCNITVNNIAPNVKPINTQAQKVTEEWVARYNGPGNSPDHANAIAIDKLSGNVYVTGTIGTIAYDSSGNELWIRDGYRGNDLTTDSLGNIYVTGYCHNPETSFDYFTLKYDPNGNELWEARYNGPQDGKDVASAIAIDLYGNVYVTGESFGGWPDKGGTCEDYATIKYDPEGNQLWVVKYKGWSFDIATAIAIDSYGNVYVTGYSYCGWKTTIDYLTIAYNSSGKKLWQTKYNGPERYKDYAHSLAVDASGIIYVTGEGGTVAYDSSGNNLWVRDKCKGYDIVNDTSGNVYVTGYIQGEYTTIKYNSSGNELWVAKYIGKKSSLERGHAIVLDSSDIVYVTGGSWTPETSWDYVTIAYDSFGIELWAATYNGPGKGSDAANAIGLDSYGNLYITGGSEGCGTNFDYATIRYSSLTSHECNEGSSATFTATATDPGSDDLTFTWNWGDGTPDTITTYYNDGTGPEPIYDPTTNEIKSPWGTYPFNATDTVSHIYGDNGVYTITLTVKDDDGGMNIFKTNITVSNINPTVVIESVTMDIEIGLRVAGRKYNNVSMTLYEDGNLIGNVSIERLPGSPNEQMAWIPVSINFSKSYNATVTYTPKDPPNVGANPVWIYLKSKDGTIKKIHHTFNVQQSKKRNSDHWNHVEPWEVDLNDYFIGLPFEISSHITDPGSDDLTLTYTYGSQTVTVTYLNNPPNPDPFPSPEVKPMDILDVTILTYEGPGTITLVVKDDDNIRLGVGEGTDSINIT